jgi:hypothetical protein
VGKSQASTDNWLLGLPSPYLQHAISTFNTCSRGPTHRSLIDSDRGYNLGDVDFLHHIPWPSQPVVSAFHLRAPPDLQLNQFHHWFQGSSFKEHMAVTWFSDHSTIYRNLHLRLAICNDLSLAIVFTRINQKVNLMHLGITSTPTT